jgi:vacuolar-type H+-ATPase subunit C/Vma6
MLSDGPYAYAKACGIIGKSFVGKRAALLAGARTLNDLYRLIFPDYFREDTVNESSAYLPSDMERRIEKRAVDQILKIVNSIANPPEILIRQLKAFEYTDLKTCLHNMAEGNNTLPNLYDIGRFRSINFKAFPDLGAMLTGTEYEFICSGITQPENMDTFRIEVQLDIKYYLGLKKSLDELSGEDRTLARHILNEEISLRNCIWALRLRTYYDKKAPEITGYLTHAEEAKQSLELPLDTREDWRGWKWERFLNPEQSGENWELNPRYFQNAAFHYLNRLALLGFHRIPMSISSIFCFIKIKQYEEDLLTSIAEGLSMGMESQDLFRLLEVLV